MLLYFWDQSNFPSIDWAEFQAAKTDNPTADIVIVRMNYDGFPLDRQIDLTQFGLLNDETGKFYRYYCDSLNFHGPTCLLIRGGKTTYIGPWIGNPDFTDPIISGLYFSYKVPGWKSPLLFNPFSFDRFFNDKTIYLRNCPKLQSMPEVLILHVWGTFCAVSQTQWPEYEVQRETNRNGYIKIPKKYKRRIYPSQRILEFRPEFFITFLFSF